MNSKLLIIIISTLFLNHYANSQPNNPNYYYLDTIQDYRKVEAIADTFNIYAQKMERLYKDTIYKNQPHEVIIHIQAKNLPIDTLRKHFVIELNKIRRITSRTNEIKLDPRLCPTTDAYAKYIENNNWFKHEDKEGNNFTYRLIKSKVYPTNKFKRACENLGSNPSTIYEMLWLWMKSIGHRHCLNYWDMDYAAIGYYKDIWVLMMVGLYK